MLHYHVSGFGPGSTTKYPTPNLASRKRPALLVVIVLAWQGTAKSCHQAWYQGQQVFLVIASCVYGSVICLANRYKILWPIIRGIAIDVMHFFARFKAPVVRLFIDKAVFQHIAVFIGCWMFRAPHKDIALASDVTATLPSIVVGARRMPRIVAGEVLGDVIVRVFLAGKRLAATAGTVSIRAILTAKRAVTRSAASSRAVLVETLTAVSTIAHVYTSCRHYTTLGGAHNAE